MYGSKIKVIRELRNFSQEYMAEKLGIKQNSYSNIENNQTKLTTEMLQKIANVLEVSPLDIMNFQPAVINFTNTQNGHNGFGYIQTFVSDQKEITEKLIASKDSEIASKNVEIARLTKQVEDLMELLKKKL